MTDFDRTRALRLASTEMLPLVPVSETLGTTGVPVSESARPDVVLQLSRRGLMGIPTGVAALVCSFSQSYRDHVSVGQTCTWLRRVTSLPLASPSRVELKLSRGRELQFLCCRSPEDTQRLLCDLGLDLIDDTCVPLWTRPSIAGLRPRHLVLSWPFTESELVSSASRLSLPSESDSTVQAKSGSSPVISSDRLAPCMLFGDKLETLVWNMKNYAREHSKANLSVNTTSPFTSSSLTSSPSSTSSLSLTTSLSSSSSYHDYVISNLARCINLTYLDIAPDCFTRLPEVCVLHTLPPQLGKLAHLRYRHNYYGVYDSGPRYAPEPVFSRFVIYYSALTTLTCRDYPLEGAALRGLTRLTTLDLRLTVDEPLMLGRLPTSLTRLTVAPRADHRPLRLADVHYLDNLQKLTLHAQDVDLYFLSDRAPLSLTELTVNGSSQLPPSVSVCATVTGLRILGLWGHFIPDCAALGFLQYCTPLLELDLSCTQFPKARQDKATIILPPLLHTLTLTGGSTTYHFSTSNSLLYLRGQRKYARHKDRHNIKQRFPALKAVSGFTI
jgi:hypothetical protein